MATMAATETGFVLIGPIGRDLHITRDDGKGVLTEASIRMPSEIQQIRLLSSDLATVLVRGEDGRTSGLILMDVSGDPAAGIFARRKGMPLSAELFDAAGLLPEQPEIANWPNLMRGIFGESLAFSGDVSAYFNGIEVASQRPADVDGMSEVELRAPPPFGGAWTLPNSLLRDGPQTTTVLLSPSAEWSAAADSVTRTVTVRERNGRHIGRFGLSLMAFHLALGPKLAIIENELDLYLWQPDAAGSTGQRELIYTSDRLIDNLVMSARHRTVERSLDGRFQVDPDSGFE